MVQQKKMNRPPRILVLFMLPMIIFMFALGWTLLWIDDQKRARRRRSMEPKEYVTILPMLQEEILELTR